MKTCAIALGAFAILGLAQGSDLRGKPVKPMDEMKYKKYEETGVPEQLLARCRSATKVEECCKEDKKDHDLYRQKGATSEGLKFVCCYKDLGTWMPTEVNSKGKFCTVTQEENHSLRTTRATFDIARQLQNLFNRLQTDKREYRRAFKEAYMAHEKVENSKRGELQLQMNQVKYVREEADKKKVVAEESEDAVDKAKADVNEQAAKFDLLVKKNKEAKQKYEDKASDLSKSVEKGKTTVSKFLSDIGTCAAAKADAKGDLAVAKKDLEELIKRQEAAKKETAKLLADRMANEGKIKAENAKFAQEKAKLDKTNAMFKAKYDKYMKKAEETRKATQAAEQELEDLVKEYNDMSFVEVGNKLQYKHLKETAPVNVEADFYAESGTKGVNGDVLSTKGQHELLNEAREFVNTEIGKSNTVLIKLKAMNARIIKLKALDQDLNRQILADIQDKASALAKVMVAAQAQLQEFSDAVQQNTADLEKLQREQRKMENAYTDAENNERNLATKRGENLEKLAKDLGDLTVKCQSLSDQFQECKKELAKAKKQLTGAVEANIKAQTEVTDMDQRADEARSALAKSEQEVQQNQLKVDNAISSLKGENQDLKDKVFEAMATEKEERKKKDDVDNKIQDQDMKNMDKMRL